MVEQRGLYGQLEDKYYDFLDWMEKSGVPVYKVVDVLEEKNIPTFPLSILLLLAVIAGAFLFVSPIVFPGQGELTVFVQDDSSNPITNATVNVTILNGQPVETLFTDATGNAIATVPMGVELLVEVLKEPDFLPNSINVTLNEQSKNLAITISRGLTTISKTIRLLKPGTSELVEQFIEVQFSCSSNSSFSETKTTTDGYITLDVPSDCGLIQANPQGNFSAQNSSFDTSAGETVELFLQEENIGTGFISASVKDSTGNPLAGITVNLIVQNVSTGLGTLFMFKETSSTGVAVFNDVPEGKYFVTVSDPAGIFSEFDSSTIGDIESLVANGSAEFAVVLDKKVIGSIKLIVRDAVTNEAVKNALVSLSKDSVHISSKESDDSGNVEFRVGEQVGYTVVVDKIGYLIETLEVVPKEDSFILLLDQATTQNSESLTVTIVDETGKPVEDVRLTLRHSNDDTKVGAEILTGSNGIGVFQRVKEDKYYVSALKPGFGEAISQTIELNRRQQNELQLTLEIGFGNIEVKVFDETKQSVAGANVSLINFSTGEVLEQGVTGADGITSLSARADKTVFVVATANGFLPYTTIPVGISKDATQNVQVDLRKEISTLSLEFVGLIVGDSIVKDSATPALNSGQRYKAKFLLLVPQGSAFEKAGVHIRTGDAEDGVTNIIEKDSLFIGETKGAFNEIKKGTSFTPSTGSSTDALHYTTSDAKWVELFFSEPSQGVFEVEVDIVVRENAKQGDILDLWYRAFGKSGGFVRFPQDSVLGSSESTAQKHALFAQAKNKKFSVGPTNLCFNEFCASVVIENISESEQTSVFEEFLAEVSSRYRLKLSISSVSDEVFPGVELKIDEGSSAIEISSFEVTTVGGSKVEGTAVGSSFSAQIGDIRKDDIFSGVFEFTPKIDGVTTLDIGLFAGSTSAKERVFEKDIFLNILPAREMNVDIVPKIIVPFVNNNVLVQVTDKDQEITLSNALVTVFKNDTLIVQGQTNSDGIFPFTLNAPNAGNTVSILVEKRGYRPIEMKIEVTENILLTIPTKVKETLVIGEQPEKEITMAILNLTQVPLVINSIEPSASFDKYLDFDFSDSIIGETLDVNGSIDADIMFSLTRAGESVKEPTTVDGSINIVVTNKELSKSWQTTVPAEVRIGFGDEVDSSDCLNFFPAKWDIFSSTNETRTISLNVQNNCRVNGAAIPLGSLQAKINLGAENEIGDFKASIDLGGEIEQFSAQDIIDLAENEEITISLQANKKISLTTGFQELAATIPANSEATITIEFRPDNVASAKQEISIDFRTAHPTANGIEYVRTSVETNISINDLATCLNISPEETLRLTTCPFNTGYDSFQGNFNGVYAQGGYPSSYGSGYGGTYGGGNQFSGANSPYGSNYGLGGYGSGYGTGGYGGGYGSGYGTEYLDNSAYRGFDPYQTQLGFGGGYGGFGNFSSQYGSFSGRTYPYSNFQAPFFDGGNFQQGFGSRFNCGSGQIRVANNCSESVEVNFESNEGLIVNNPNIVLEKGKQETVFVQPTYFSGTQPIKVSAKLSTSEELPQEIAELRVNIENSLTQSYRDCVSINPPRILKFNNFYGKPVVLEVRNSCYELGVRLFRTNDTIFFPSEVLRNPNDIPGSGIHEMIENWALLDETFEVGADGRTTQVQRFELFKALKNYCNTAPTFPNPDTQSPFSVIGNLRYFFSQGYYSVKGRSNMVVNFFTEQGQRRSISFPLIIEDWWEAVPFAERLVSYGDPYIPAATCIAKGKSKLDLKGKFKCIPETELEVLERNGYSTDGGGAGGLMSIAIPLSQANSCGQFFATSGLNQTLPLTGNQIDTRRYNPSYIDGQNVPVRTGSARSFPGQLEQGGCGTVDTISELTPRVIEQNGLKINVSIQNGNEILLTFDAAEWRKLEKPKVDISEKLFVTVNRVVPAISDRTTIPLTFCLEGGEGIIKPPINGGTVDPANAKACSDGSVTGKDAFEGFGFDKLLFDWRADKVGKNSCETDFYCDAAQFSIALNKKTAEIQKAVEKAGNCTVEGKDCDEDSLNLYRYFTKFVEVKDSVEGKLYQFFADKDTKLIENSTVKEALEKETGNLTKGIVDKTLSSTDARKKVIRDTLELVEKISVEETLNGGEVLVLLNATDLKKTSYDGQRNKLGMDKTEIGSKEYYVMTLKEFETFYSDLQDATKEGNNCSDSLKTNCWVSKNGKTGEITEVKVQEIEKSNDNGVLISLAFLTDFQKALANGKIVIGIRSVENVSEEKKKLVMQSITDFEFSSSEYKNFYEFYNQNISFSSQLIEDGYSKDFQTDFITEYSTAKVDSKPLIIGEFEKWEFSPQSIQAGVYNVTLNYDWNAGNDKPKIKIQTNIDKPLSEIKPHYAKNVLFFLPVDGTLGLENGVLNRDGYGMRFSPQEFPAGLLNFNYYGNKSEDQQPYLYFTSASTKKYNNRFDPQNKGEFLKLSKNRVNFNPTDPIAISIQLNKSTAQTERAGLLYSLNDGTQVVFANNLIGWNFSKDNIGLSQGAKTFDSQFERNLLCGTGTDIRNGFVKTNGRQGQSVMRTVLYAPTRYANIVGDSLLNIDCFKDSATVTKIADPASGTEGTKTLNRGENTLNNENTHRLLDTYTMKNFVEMIKTDKELVCVKAQNNQLTFSWNENEILKKVS